MNGISRLTCRVMQNPIEDTNKGKAIKKDKDRRTQEAVQL